ncbi:regulator of G-protein signaling domain-containing protein [Jatrophihabitans fulvus]
MKSSDAKNPKFDAAWWKANKSKAADANGEFEKVLKAYATQRDSLIADKKANKEPQLSSSRDLHKALTAIKNEAVKQQKDPKLGVAQRETKEALAVYAKKAETAAKAIQAFEGSPMRSMKADQLSRHAPQFRSFLVLKRVEENVDFLAAVRDGKINLATYQRFIADGSPAEINIDSSLRREFATIADEVTAKRQPDTTATWKNAPWKDAYKVIVDLLDAEPTTKFQKWATAQVLAPQLP